mgnify:CR=1 FL=1
MSPFAAGGATGFGSKGSQDALQEDARALIAKRQEAEVGYHP